jgi:hypothetical protein
VEIAFYVFSLTVVFYIMIQIIIGVIVWLVLPPFLSGRIKKKGDRKAMSILCKIMGGAIIGWGIISVITNLANQTML